MQLVERFRRSVGEDVEALWFSADGGSLVARGEHRGALYAVPSGALVAEGEHVPTRRHAFSRDGRVALGGASLRVLDARTGAVWASVEAGGFGSFLDVALRGDGALAAAVSARGVVAVIELPHGRVRTTLGGYRTRDRWSCETTLHGASFHADGRRLLTYGTVIEAFWGVAAHHGLPDEEYEREDFVTVWDVETGLEVATTSESRRRYDEGVRRSAWIPGGDLVLEDRDGEAFVVLGPDLSPRCGEYPDEPFREVHATADGARVVTVGREGGATLWTFQGQRGTPTVRAQEGDAFNGFGLPTVPGEAPPRYRVLATERGAEVTTWPDGARVAVVHEDVRRIAVRPGSGGLCFATLAGDELANWELVGEPRPW